MRSFFRFVVRLMGLSASSSIGWIALAFVTLWGGLYLTRCFELLQAPGLPIELKYQAAQGQRSIHADSFVVNPWAKTLTLRNPAVFDGKRRVVWAKDMLVSLAGPTYDVTTRGLALSVKRKKDRSLDVLNLVPKSEPGAKGPPVRFRAATVLVHYEDAAKPGHSDKLLLRRVEYLQSDSIGVGNCQVIAPGLEAFNLSLQLGSHGKYWAEGRSIRGDIARLVALAVDQPLDKSVTYGKILVEGDATISGANGPADLRLDMAFRVPDFRSNGISGALSGTVFGSLSKSTVRANLSENGRKAEFYGQAAMVDRPWFAGHLTVRAESLWPALSAKLPKSTAVHGGSAKLWVAYDGETLAMSGQGRLSKVDLAGQRLTNVAANLTFDGTRADVSVTKASWQGGSAKGRIWADLGRSSLMGFVDLGQRKIETLLPKQSGLALKGRASSFALLSGPFNNVEATVVAFGDAYLDGKGDTTYLGPFEARVGAKGKVATIERFVLSGPNGVVSAHGSYNLSDKYLNISVVAGAVPASAFGDGLDGVLFGSGSVTGKLTSPKYQGHIEAYGLAFQGHGAPVAVADFEGDKEGLDVYSIVASSGTGSARGALKVDYSSKALKGTFAGENLSLAELIGPDTLGLVKVESGVVSGTLDNPVLSAKLEGDRLTAFGTSIDRAEAIIEFENSIIDVSHGLLTSNEGSAKFEARSDLATSKGSVEAKFESLPLERILRFGPELAFEGLANGQMSLSVDSGVWSGTGGMSVANVMLNGTPIGAGQIALTSQDNMLSLTGIVGSIDRFLSLDELKVNPAEKSFQANVSAFNMQLRDILSATKPVWNQANEDIEELVSSVDGGFTGTAKLTGQGQDWDLAASDLTLDNLVINGRPAGKLVAVVNRKGAAWHVPEVKWLSGESVLSASGMVGDDKSLDAKVNIDGFDLTWIHTLWPQTPLVTGKASIAAVSGGTTDDPIGQASVLVDDAVFVGSDGKTGSPPINVLIDEFRFGNNRLSASGQARFQGFVGKVSASVPYSAFAARGSNKREPLQASIDFIERPLGDFAEQLPDVDMTKSEGIVAFRAQISGLIDDLAIQASGNVKASKFVSKNMDTELKNVRVDFTQNGRQAKVSGHLESGIGGFADFDLTGQLADIFNQDFNTTDLLEDSSVRGSMVFDQFGYVQKLPSAIAPTVVRANGNFKVSGTIGAPIVSGGVNLDKVALYLPTDVIASAAAALPIDPKFDNVRFNVSTGSRIETGLGALVVSGPGSLNGSLARPQVSLPLTLEEGVFRLPNGRLTLEPGGTITVVYSSLAGGEPVARANIDLEGHTTVVSKSATGQYEPYHVTVNIRGNVMDENSLSITGYSDPPDLSQSEILALIGQRDLLQGLAEGVLGANRQDVFRDTFFQLAVPSLSQNLTQGIAQGLRLDYLSVDYNPFDQFVMSAGKSLTKNLSLQVSRQLQEIPGRPLRFEVKLVYRPPLRDKLLSRLRFGLGFDQTVPWKFSVSWSRRS